MSECSYAWLVRIMHNPFPLKSVILKIGAGYFSGQLLEG